MEIKNYKLPYSSKDITFIQNLIGKILKKGYLTDGGEYVKQLEDLWAGYVNTTEAAAVNSCTTALELICKAIDVKDHSVIVPNYTFYASPLSVLNAGGKVIYSDINPQTLSLDVENIKKQIRKDTKAVMIVHVGGVISDEIFKIKQFCKDNNLYLIEDAACAHGAELNGYKAGSIGDISAFSFHHSKTLTSGEGGIINTNNTDWINKIKRMRAVGLDRSINNWEVFELGSNYKMTEITAALGILHVTKASKILDERRKIADFYNENINFNSDFKKMEFNCKSSYYKYIIFTNSKIKKELPQHLQSRGIELPPTVYDYLCSEQNINKHTRTLNYNDKFPGAQQAMKSNLCLPMYNGLTKAELTFIVDSINEYLK